VPHQVKYMALPPGECGTGCSVTINRRRTGEGRRLCYSASCSLFALVLWAAVTFRHCAALF
jgi:hypothetical protein